MKKRSNAFAFSGEMKKKIETDAQINDRMDQSVQETKILNIVETKLKNELMNNPNMRQNIGSSSNSETHYLKEQFIIPKYTDCKKEYVLKNEKVSLF